jgi:hypothetical protein
LAQDSLAPDPDRAPVELRDPFNHQIGLLTADQLVANCSGNVLVVVHLGAQNIQTNAKEKGGRSPLL